MIVYKTAIPDQFIHLATIGRDKTILKEHIETAFATFPSFCGDKSATDDAFTSCKKDIVGFLFYLQTRDWSATVPNGLEFY